MTTAPPLTRIRVVGLFGLRNYDIRLDPRRPTVLTGSNGTGKSTLLRLINAVAAGDAAVLAAAPLRELTLEFGQGPSLVLERIDASAVSVRWGDNKSVLRTHPLVDALPEWAASVVGEARYQDEAEDIPVRLRKVAQAARIPFDEYRRVREAVEKGLGEEGVLAPPWFAQLTGAFPVLFISDQRLVVESPGSGKGAHQEKSTQLAVEAASRDIAQQMRQADSSYARVSQQQDRRFPRDVIQAMKQADRISPAQLTELFEKVEAKRERLHLDGLLDPDEHGPKLDPKDFELEQAGPVIAAFLRSTHEKLAELEPLSSRLSAFREFLDQRFVGKRMMLDRHDGVQFVLRGGETIRPRRLSSGEQQMFVMAYEILFRTRSKTLIVIDEPEISLHVLWQDTLIDHFIEMGRASDLQFLLASHSPVLLADHPELERSLDWKR